MLYVLLIIPVILIIVGGGIWVMSSYPFAVKHQRQLRDSHVVRDRLQQELDKYKSRALEYEDFLMRLASHDVGQPDLEARVLLQEVRNRKSIERGN